MKIENFREKIEETSRDFYNFRESFNSSQNEFFIRKSCFHITQRCVQREIQAKTIFKAFNILHDKKLLKKGNTSVLCSNKITFVYSVRGNKIQFLTCYNGESKWDIEKNQINLKISRIDHFVYYFKKNLKNNWRLMW